MYIRLNFVLQDQRCNLKAPINRYSRDRRWEKIMCRRRDASCLRKVSDLDDSCLHGTLIRVGTCKQGAGRFNERGILFHVEQTARLASTRLRAPLSFLPSFFPPRYDLSRMVTRLFLPTDTSVLASKPSSLLLPFSLDSLPLRHSGNFRRGW
jgi:hypothetical protein